MKQEIICKVIWQINAFNYSKKTDKCQLLCILISYPYPKICKALHILGRKNWLFAGNHQSAERSGIIYSILESCVLNNIEPFAYIQDVLTRLPDLMFAPKEKIDELLPGNWKPATLKIYSAPGRQESINAA